jgi:hypothetical protein
MKTVPVVASLLLLAACGTEGESDRSADAPELTTRLPVTVLDDGGGAELCLGMVQTSLPPQCDGMRLVGWDWAEHAGAFEQSGKVRWGEFVVTGTFDGEAMTPTEVVAAAELKTAPSYAEEMPDLSTPCPEPDGGWVVDQSRAGSDDMERAFRVAKRLDDYGSSYIDNAHGVVNVRVTGDLDAAESALREVWGGGLCIRGAAHTDIELAKIQAAVIESVPDLLGAGRDERVDVQVTYDDGSIQRSFDEQYGAGVVNVESALVPVGAARGAG